MMNSDRRRFLQQVLGTLVTATGAAVVASAAGTRAVTPAEPIPVPPSDQPSDIQERADQLAETTGATEEEVPVSTFLNRGFRNAGFANGGFRNGGGFVNRGFRNGFGGGFRNGAFRNF